jgi:hypothetical protein
MSRKRRTRPKQQHEKKRADNSSSEYVQDTSSRASVIGPDNPSSSALESEPKEATPCEAELGFVSCSDESPVSENLVDEPDRVKEEMILGEIQVVQDYMDALLNRVRGENAPQTRFVPVASRSKKGLTQARSKKPLAAETADPSAKADCECQSLPPLAELTARSKPPESIGWGSMRDLANSQARAAIDAHQRVRLSKSVLNNGAAGLACLIGTVVALICAPVLGQTMGIGPMAGVVASIYFLYSAFLSARAWLISRSSSLD